MASFDHTTIDRKWQERWERDARSRPPPTAAGPSTTSSTCSRTPKVLEQRESRTQPRPAVRSTTVLPGTAAAPAPGFGPDGMPITTAARKPNALDAAIREVNDAEGALAAAKQKLEQGREPLPGERLGLKGGGSRLLPEYETRVAALERDVINAEARLKRAQDARNAAR